MNNTGVDPGAVFALAAAGFGIVFMLLVFGAMLWLLPAWLRGFLGGAPVMVLQLIAMRFRGVPPGLIVDALVTLVQRHPHDLSRVRMAESLYLAQRGLIDSPAQLADQMEKQIKTGKV
ncbi:MAG: hypothetical protein ACR2FY_14065 [Pirellulaceae bacterium]